MGREWIRVKGFWIPDSIEPFDDYGEKVVEGEWESYNVIFIGEESGRFWGHRKKPGMYRWQGYTFTAETSVKALLKLIDLVERVEREGRI
jgi:hypothetical protein